MYLPWMVDANFTSLVVFILLYSRSVWHPFGCFILHMDYFILFCVTFSLHIFIIFILHCRPKYFFLSSCAWNSGVMPITLHRPQLIVTDRQFIHNFVGPMFNLTNHNNSYRFCLRVRDARALFQSLDQCHSFYVYSQRVVKTHTSPQFVPSLYTCL